MFVCVAKNGAIAKKGTIEKWGTIAKKEAIEKEGAIRKKVATAKKGDKIICFHSKTVLLVLNLANTKTKHFLH